VREKGRKGEVEEVQAYAAATNRVEFCKSDMRASGGVRGPTATGFGGLGFGEL
jgi:hypothetical protein